MLFRSTESFTAAAGSVASFVVPHVDQAGFINGSGAAVTNWSYVATVTYTSSTNSIATRTVAFQPFVGQSSIDLDLVNDGTVTSPTTSPTATVTSVNGQTGAVTISAVGGLSDVASTITANNSAVTESKFNPVDASSGPLTVTLAAASAAGKNVAIAKTDTSTNLVTVSIANYRGSASTVSLATRNQSLLLVGKADGSWWPMGDHNAARDLPGVRVPGRAISTQAVIDGAPEATFQDWIITPPAATFAASALAAWPAANAAIGMRFTVRRTRTFRYVNLYVGTSSGNIQVAISRCRPAAGTTTMDVLRVADSGIIACPAGSNAARIDLGYVTLTPGDYMLTLWCDNTTATFLNGLATGITASRIAFTQTGLSTGINSGVTTLSVTTRWVSGLTLEAANLPIALLGDSITANDTSSPSGTGSWFSVADDATGYRFYPQTNNGVAGERSDQILSRAAAAFSGKRYATILAGTNDIGQGVSAATIISNLQSIYAAAVSAGLKGFAVCTIPPRVGTSGALTTQQAADLRAVNEWIRANYTSYAGAVLVDWSWALSDGTSETSPLAGNFQDGIHPNATGRDIMARILKNAIRDWA